jgi:LacI family transcriptional regulator
MFDRLHEKMGTYPIEGIVLDDYLGAFKATEHLINQGSRQIAHFAGPQHVNIYKERKRGYEEALKRHNMPVNEELIFESDVKLHAGRELGEKLISQNKLPDGISSSSDYAAGGAMEILKEQKINVPDDIAVVGFGNEPFTSFTKLTTVDQHGEEMGQMAAKLFLDEIKDESSTRSKSKTVLNPELIVRDSSLRKENENRFISRV